MERAQGKRSVVTQPVSQFSRLRGQRRATSMLYRKAARLRVCGRPSAPRPRATVIIMRDSEIRPPGFTERFCAVAVSELQPRSTLGG